MRCKNGTFYDNGYLYGYYCDLTGNKCDCSSFQEHCILFEEKDDEEEDDEE